jgi:hypothetical protein
METFGKVLLATETRVSVAGPALAGVNVLAVSAAQISRADRKEANISAVNFAVKRPD